MSSYLAPEAAAHDVKVSGRTVRVTPITVTVFEPQPVDEDGTVNDIGVDRLAWRAEHNGRVARGWTPLEAAEKVLR